jgi:hypothetical protein
MEVRRHQTLRSPHEVGARRLARVTPWGRCQVVGTEPHAPGWCLSSGADSHQAKAPIESGRAKPVFRRQREPGGSPLRPEKDGLASGGRWSGRYGVSPLEWVAPHEVGAREKLFPPQEFRRRSLNSKEWKVRRVQTSIPIRENRINLGQSRALQLFATNGSENRNCQNAVSNSPLGFESPAL